MPTISLKQRGGKKIAYDSDHAESFGQGLF